VLIDVTRGGRGVGFVARVRQAVPSAAIIALAGFDADDLRATLSHAGTVGQLAKRVRPTALAGEIRAMVGVLQIVSDAVARVDTVGTTLAAHAASGREARSFVSTALEHWACGDLAQTVSLLVSELVANAVQHARSTAEISVLLHPGCVRIEVADDDPTIPKRRLVGPESPSGRGLALVEQLSSSWGIDPTPKGKVVWFEVARPEPPPGGGDHDGRGPDAVQ
jgi:anti-sigma regulatory factor (Ser/Thr protein kinase)